ncbi:DUF6503 family protein [Muriicola soli]|uniref:Threonine synthase n=1 Tax=Muriicola soli TaxID=2507538 RepID=A0A411EAB5_9FLAO|nr:DUF6503 family protein [Muriicola soli]QBA64588.1 hypothetical protein EQY75_08640 [Muriicola soli]
MRNTVLFLIILLVISCKDMPKEQPDKEMKSEIVEEEVQEYPEALNEVFKAHGGLASWKNQKYLSYEIPKKSGREKHQIDLYSRKDIVETDDFSMGFDGQDVWLFDPEGKYKGDPVFYHNLMFYFYAMPFVLADDGIEYFETEAISYNGKEYPGIGIRYEDGIGTSPEDEYYLHYDPETMQMAWLGYTVTYRTGVPSDDIHWIRYNNWTDISGLLLPQSITWHKVEEGKIGEPGNTVAFQEIKVSEQAADKEVFARPDHAEIRKPVNTTEK